jgi:hypothetical protein
MKLSRYIICYIAFAACIFITGCASSVVPAGPDTYYVSYGPLPITMSAAKGKAHCYQQASAWCQARGLVMVPISSDAQEAIAFRNAGHADLTFRALKPGDPAITNHTEIR